nr:EH signature domain-containing protein [uncultured Cohaesibacter sp.]
MTLRQAFTALTVIRTAKLSFPDKLQRECEKIRLAFPGADSVPSQALDELIADLQTRLEHWNWDGIHQGDIDTIARCVFAGKGNAPEKVIHFLCNEASASTRPSFLGTIAEAYLESWNPDNPLTKFMAGCLIKRSTHLPGRWQKLFQFLPECLELQDGPTKLAQRMLGESNPYRWLQDNGMVAPHGPGFMQFTFKHYLDSLPAITTQSRLQPLILWLSPSKDQILSGDPAQLTLDKLLSPWLRQDPETSFKDNLIREVLRLYGDPRKDHQEIWQRVSTPSRGVIMRWLAGKSMEAFMAIVSEIEDGHMWEPRRVFWMALHEQGYVDEAWVALPPGGEKIAQRKAAQSGDQSYLGFGRQIAKGNRKNTSLLIMKIGEKIVVEGSHNYRVHIFRPQMTNRPELYQTDYNAEAMTLPNHHPDTYYHFSGWQTNVKRAIL